MKGFLVGKKEEQTGFSAYFLPNALLSRGWGWGWESRGRVSPQSPSEYCSKILEW